MLNPGRVLTRAQLLSHVWDYDFGGSSTVVSTYVTYLRRKLASDGPNLGLAIAAEIASAHGGTAQAAPASPHGLRVTLTLPARSGPRPAPELAATVS